MDIAAEYVWNRVDGHWYRVDKENLRWAKCGYKTKKAAECDVLTVAAKKPQEIGKLEVKRGGWWWRR